MNAALSWETDGKSWPHHDHSQFVESGGLTWHVQIKGAGPDLLLIHGTGASTHSWRDCLPILAKRFRVIAFDLPGHGFTSALEDANMSLPALARAVTGLSHDVKASPACVVGHSAGAAIAVRMILDGGVAPGVAMSVNGALLPFPGFGLLTLPMMFKALFSNPFAAPFATEIVRGPGNIRQAIANTGTELSEQGLAFYERLFTSDRHLDATLKMMTHWDLAPLKRDLSKLHIPLTAVFGAEDLAIPAWQARELVELAPAADVIELSGCGHIAPEEKPKKLSKLVIAQAKSAGLFKTA